MARTRRARRTWPTAPTAPPRSTCASPGSILGTGNALRFPRPELQRPLIERQKGLEVMDFRAACRTYNVLVSEGRKVAAALLFS